MPSTKPEWLPSKVWQFLLSVYPKSAGPYSRIWSHAYEAAAKAFGGRTAELKIHGTMCVLNYGHAYPLYARRFTRWNQPLVELVHEVHSLAGRPISFVDVGSGIGDTILLLNANCPGNLGQVYAIDGDEEFFRYLSANFSESDSVHRYQVMLSADDGEVASLVRHNTGSGSAQGSSNVKCRKLEDVLGARDSGIDVLKIDVDGFDGRVLKGSVNVLLKDTPAIIFEWHPILCREAKNSWLEHFDILESCGYDRFIWYSKYGDFSHFSQAGVRKDTEMVADLCFAGLHDHDWHYDIIALHSTSRLSPLTLAGLSFAKARRSQY